MKSKHIITGILLLFVVASVAFLVFKESKEKPMEGSSDETAIDRNPEGTSAPGGIRESDKSGRESGESGRESGESGRKSGESGRTVIAYYFLTTKRCPTCRKIEAYTTEAIETAFARQLESGRLEFHVVNVDEPENSHYIDDYQLTTKSVVLADYRGGEQTRWKNLDRVWQYVGDKQTFMDYIEDETNKIMGELSHE